MLEGEVGFALAPDHRVALIHTQLRKQRGPGEVDRLRDDDVAAGRCVCIARFMLDLRSESSSLCEEWTRQSYLIAYCCGRATRRQSRFFFSISLDGCVSMVTSAAPRLRMRDQTLARKGAL